MRALFFLFAFSCLSLRAAYLESEIVPFGTERADQIVLANDGYNESGGPAYVQMGFIKQEKAGIWTRVPERVPCFQAEYFRILIGSGGGAESKPTVQAFFQMGQATAPQKGIPAHIENAVQLTAGPYWNDVPAQGLSGPLAASPAGTYVGASIEFTHDGLPSVFRDADGLSNAAHNLIFAIPGNWQYASTFGVTGDWILRIVGRSVDSSRCR